MKGQTTCHCGCGLDIQNSLRTVLTKIETELKSTLSPQYELNLNCGARCEKHNAEVGGVKNSAHCLGLAADINLITSQEKYAFIAALYHAGIKRIEDRLLNAFYIHFDIATGAVPYPYDGLTEYPQNVYIVLP